jgi:hypothetical protein
MSKPPETRHIGGALALTLRIGRGQKNTTLSSAGGAAERGPKPTKIVDR